jgi:hypothetical protein
MTLRPAGLAAIRYAITAVWRRPPILRALASLIVISCAAPVAAGVSTLRQSQQPIANFSFASQLGAGVYNVDGRSVQIYRLPFEFELRAPTEERVGWDLTLPVTMGFFGYRVQDVVEQGLPGHVDTYSFLPGIEVSRLFGPQWRLAAFAQLGVANVPADSSANLIYATGGRARYLFRLGQFHMRYAAELLYAGSQVDHHVDDTMVRVTNGIDALHSTRMSMRGEVVDFGPYAMNEWFPKRPDAPAGAPGPPMSALQWEVGMTIGTVNTAYVWKVPVPRIGLGYRFGRDLSVVRLVFGSAF